MAVAQRESEWRVYLVDEHEDTRMLVSTHSDEASARRQAMDMNRNRAQPWRYATVAMHHATTPRP